MKSSDYYADEAERHCTGAFGTVLAPTHVAVAAVYAALAQSAAAIEVVDKGLAAMEDL